jgi:hypothetical protein
MSEISEVLDHLINDVLAPGESAQGCSGSEISELMADQGVTRLPSAYICFLKRAGRGAGQLLVGTKAFYPQIIGLKSAAKDLFTEDGVVIELENDAFVIAMHQGYQVFWFPTVIGDDPKVIMFQEGDTGPTREWVSFSAYLRGMIKAIER